MIRRLRHCWSLFALLLALAGCGEHERASEYQQAAQLDAADHEHVHQAIESIQAGRVDEGLRLLAELKHSQPAQGRSTAWLPNAVEALLGQGEFALADSLMDIVGPPTRRPPELRYWTAQLEMTRGDHAAARPHFEAAFGDPVWGISALFEAAMLESARGGHEEAAALCRRLLARERHHEGARLLLASSLLDSGQIDAAFEVAEGLSSESARASVFAHGHLLAGRPDEALRVLDESEDFQGSLRDYLEGWASLEKAEAARAVPLLKPLAEAQPRPYKDSQALLARAYHELGDEESAARFESEAELSERGFEAGRLQDEGVRAAQAGDFEEGRRLLAQAAELNPDDATILNDLAAILTQLEYYDVAEMHFLRAAELRPDDAAIAANMAQLYTLMGDIQKAEAQRARFEALRGN